MACDNYRLSRRRFLAGSVATASLLGMNVRDLIALSTPGTPDRGTAQHVILLWMSGGMSHIDTFDPKPNAASGGEFKPIKTTAPGIDIAEILPNIATQMKHIALIRSLSGHIGDHAAAARHVLTGYQPAPQLVHPGMGSIIAHELSQQGDLPSYITIGGRAPAAGYLGQTCEAYFVAQAGQPDPYVRLPDRITELRDNRRFELLQKINKRYKSHTTNDNIEHTDATYIAARHFMRSPALTAFELQHESQPVRDAYSDSDFGRGCLLARRLIEQGVRFVQVNTGGFDTHKNNFDRMRTLSETIDKPIATLISDLAASGLLSRTLVVLLSEFGRSPRINPNAGRDHHPHAFSCIMAGGGIKPATLIGQTDPDGHHPDGSAVHIGDIHATVCHVLGIDPAKQVHTPLGRPMKLVGDGKPIADLL